MLEKTNSSNLTALKLALVGATAVGGSTLSAIMNTVSNHGVTAHADTLNQNQNQNNNNQQKTYTVVKGDSVWKIARDNNLKVQDIVNWNHLGSDAKIITGQKLNLSQPQDDNGVYTVVQGDTLSKIAQKFNLSLSQVFQYNPQYNANNTLIRVGDKINVSQDAANRNNQSAPAQQATQTASTQAVQQAAPAQTYSASSNYQAPSLGGSEQAAKDWIAARESGGSYTAQNGNYYGKFQLSRSYLGGDYSPANQERVANNYVHSRYGSWTAAQAFWQAHGWY